MPQFQDAEGNIWEATSPNDPNPVFVSGPQQAQGVVLPAQVDPLVQPRVQGAQLDNTGQAINNTVAQGTAPTTIQTNQAPAGYIWVDPNNPRAGVVPIPGFTPSGSSAPDPLKLAQFRALEQQIARVEQLYRAGPGSTSGVAGVADYLPSDANAAFDSAGAGLSEVGLAAFRVPGVGSQSDTELRQFVKANTPQAGDRDSAIEEKLRNLRTRLVATKEQLGIAPDRQQDDQTIPGSALDVLRTNPGQGGGGGIAPLQDAGSGGFQVRDNPALARAHDDLVQTLLSEGGGRLDPQAYAQGRTRLIQEFGLNVPNPLQDAQAGAAWANQINDYLDAGGRTVPTGASIQEAISATDTMRNNLVNNPLGAALLGAANTGGLGVPEALNPGAMAALRDAQGGSVLAGEIGGAIGATSAIGAGGRAVAGRLAPQLLQGGARGQFARNVAADAAFGGAYGGITEGDPLTGAAFGAGGSVLGQGVARGLGAAVGGAQRTAASAALRARGVPVSVGRQLGAGRAEDLAASIPFVGDAVRGRQADSFAGFNQAAFQEAGAPIGANIPNIAGRDGIAALDDAVGNAYTQATQGVRAPIDTQFYRDLRPVTRDIRALPDDYRASAETIFDKRVGPAIAGGELTGDSFQQAIRGIRQARSNANNVGTAGFEQEYRGALTGVEDLLTGTMQRGGGQRTLEGLGKANEAYGNLKILEDASLDRAKIGTQTGEANVFTPAQLLAAARKSEAKYGGGQALRELGEQGQQVLPSTVPNSGTADRALFAGLAGSAGIGAGLGGGAGGFSGGDLASAGDGAQSGAITGATLAAALAALGTRGGQRALEQILITRPQVAQRVGRGIRRQGGIFGSSGAALGLQGQ